MSKFDRGSFGSAVNHFGGAGQGHHLNNGLTITEGADAPSSSSTPYSVSGGDIFVGTLEGDASYWPNDWIAIDLEAGESVTVTVTGIGNNPELDPYLVLYNASSNSLVSANAGGTHSTALLTYDIVSSGTYYLKVESWDRIGGQYQAAFEVGDTPENPGSSNDPLEAIDWGSKLSSTTVNVYFGTAGFSADGITSEGFNAYQKAQFNKVFGLIEDVSGLTFNVVSSAASADFKLIMDTNEMSSNLYGYMNPPGYATGSAAGVGAFNGNVLGSAAGGNFDLGGLGFYVIAHELSHGLGLAHPHDNGGNGTGNDSTILDGVTGSGSIGTYGLNQGHYTIMSYNAGFVSGSAGTTGHANLWGMASGPGALDIAVLQAKYGANTTYHNTGTSYVMGDVHGSGAHWKAIWDTGGLDKIVYYGTRDVTIDLRAATLDQNTNGGGYNSAVAGVAGGLTIAHGVVIERAYGGSGDDTLIGDDGNNLLNGGAGNDLITGNDGHDLVYGKDGDDTIDVGTGNDTVVSGRGNDEITGGLGEDNLKGGGGSDTIDGGQDNDSIYGQGAADTINAGSGDDYINAGGGFDLVFAESGNDSVIGGSGNDTIHGNAGNDTLVGSTGHDVMNGGEGNDDLFGSAQNDTLRGGAGDDTLHGGADDDEIDGGAGNDLLIGGGQADVFVFHAGYGSNVVQDFSAAKDTLRLESDLVGTATTGLEVLSLFGSVSGADVTLTFADGTVIEVLGVTEAALAGEIEIF